MKRLMRFSRALKKFSAWSSCVFQLSLVGQTEDSFSKTQCCCCSQRHRLHPDTRRELLLGRTCSRMTVINFASAALYAHLYDVCVGGIYKLFRWRSVNKRGLGEFSWTGAHKSITVWASSTCRTNQAAQSLCSSTSTNGKLRTLQEKYHNPVLFSSSFKNQALEPHESAVNL